jgi:hypothetical protein
MMQGMNGKRLYEASLIESGVIWSEAFPQADAAAQMFSFPTESARFMCSISLYSGRVYSTSIYPVPDFPLSSTL